MDESSPSRILVTGFSGFVGGYLLAALSTRYPRARLFGVCQRRAEGSSTASPAEGTAALVALQTLQADMTQPQQVRRAVACAAPDLVFHLAGRASVAASWAAPAETLAINAGGAVNLFEALRAEGLAPRIVLVGSGEQYGLVKPEENPLRETCPARPANPYATSKAAQDLYGYQYAVAFGLPIVRARPFNHFGPRQTDAFVIANFARQIARIEAGRAEPALLVGNLQSRRDFLPVADVVRAYLALAERGRPGEAYNVGSGQARSIEEMLSMLLALARTRIEVRADPARLRPTDMPLLVADITRIQAHTGWAPQLDLAEALRQTLDYWRAEASGA